MDYAIKEYVRKLDNIILLADKIDKDNVELRSHMAKYLCIRISGLMEAFFKRHIESYLDGKSPKPVQNYVNSRFKNFTSVNTKKISDTMGLFSKEWEEAFINAISDSQKDSLDAVISNRHNLAHGKDPGITLTQIKKYYTDVKDVITLVELIISK